MDHHLEMRQMQNNKTTVHLKMQRNVKKFVEIKSFFVFFSFKIYRTCHIKISIALRKMLELTRKYFAKYLKFFGIKFR